MALATHTASAVHSSFLPVATRSLLAEHAITESHVDLLLANRNVMRALHHFDQVRRDISANPSSDVHAMLYRISMAQQMLLSWMHAAWQHAPLQQKQLENMDVQLALIDGLLCTQP